MTSLERAATINLPTKTREKRCNTRKWNIKEYFSLTTFVLRKDLNK